MSKDLSPGRELDAIIAEKVMGWQPGVCNGLVEEYFSGWICQECQTVGQWGEQGNHQKEPKPYSTDIASAWSVLEHLKSRFEINPATDGFLMSAHFEQSLHKDRSATYYVRLEFESQNVYAESDSFPHAICLAALKAVESKK